jgi:putative glutamine amidotransferase
VDAVSGTSGSAAPVVGLTAYDEQVRWGVWDVPGVLLPAAYVRAVAAAGGVPVLLPPLPDGAGPGAAGAVVARLDALVLSGGPDIDPGRYGAPRAPETGPARPERDASELALLAAATAAAVPVLGVCRGLQLLNVARGGTLHQHLPDVVGTADHAPAPGVYGRHPVAVAAGSRLADALGRTAGEVASYHHQAVATPGAGLVVTARASDGTVEAVEDPDLPFCLAVQWHPEAGHPEAGAGRPEAGHPEPDTGPALFRALVAAAREHAAARTP